MNERRQIGTDAHLLYLVGLSHCSRLYIGIIILPLYRT